MMLLLFFKIQKNENSHNSKQEKRRTCANLISKAQGRVGGCGGGEDGVHDKVAEAMLLWKLLSFKKNRKWRNPTISMQKRQQLVLI